MIGEPVNSATKLMEARGLDTDVRSVERDAPRDTVLEQDPTEGDNVKKGSTVVLTVSSGPGIVEVPKVEGLATSAARKKLETAGLKVEIRREFSDRDQGIDVGQVIGTDPAAGTEVKGGSTVGLLVSKGIEEVDVPSVVGMQRDAAETTLRDAGLDPQVEEEDSDEPENQVIDQSPDPGTKLERNAEVIVTVSSGQGSIEVAGVVGRTQQQATNILRGQGLVVGVRTTSTSSPEDDGIVTQQSPPAGVRARRGDRATITVGRFGGGRPVNPTP